MATAGLDAKRPLSPHLQIYRFAMTMAMSIMHRITGAGLYFGTALLTWWLVAAATGRPYFDYVNGLLGSWLGLVLLFGFSWALIHHLLGGLRFLVMDVGAGLGKPARDIMATATLVGSITLTILLWVVGLAVC